MGKYNFDNLYENATKLDQDFLRDEFGYSINSEYDDIIYKNYYVNICGAINQINTFSPTSKEIEEILEKGYTPRLRRFKSLIESAEERKYLFLLAQAKQLKYDRDNGRAGMIKDNDEKWQICKDTFELLSRIGFNQPVRY